MALDPNIALGVRPLEVPNQLAQYGQLAQIQNAQNQNALAQYQLSAAQRADEQQSNLYAAAKQPNFKLDFSTAIQYGAPGIAAYKAQQESSKTQGEIDAQVRKAALDRADAFSTALAPLVTNVQAGKPLTHNDVFAQANRLVAQGLLRKEDLGTIPMNAAELPSFVMNMATATENSRKTLQTYMPKTRDRDIGGVIQTIQDNPMMPGYGMPVAGMAATPKTQTFADINAAATLKFNKDKFAWEKANPTLSIQQTPTGYVAVNTTNGMAIPVLYGQDGFQAAGGAQPATAPGASMMRQPPAALPGQRTPAIPGMASVLDQTAAPAVAPTVEPMALPVGTPGTPVMGKQSELKPIPSNINLAILKNNQSIQQIDETIKLLQQNPSATGVKGYLPGFALNRMDPSGVEARAGVADIGSLVLHDRSGAAVTAAEAPRLVPFIPLPTDDNATVIKKLTRMRNIAAQEQTGLTETYGKDQGYAPNPTVGRAGGAPLSAQQIPPIYATNGKERIVSIDGGKTWTPAK
jgi:hypothetical protein